MLTRQHIQLCILFVMLNLTGCNENPDKQLENQPVDPTLCAFTQGECVKKVGDLILRVSLSPEHAPSEKPLKLKILSSDALDNVRVRVEGRDMFMGILPINIRQHNKTTYEGQLIYGSCSSRYMVWRGFISFSRNGVEQTVIFDFLADNPR